jgi:D-aminopeptidase
MTHIMTMRASSSLKAWSALAVVVSIAMPLNSQISSDRPRARQAGVVVGSLPLGALNAITDVAGVRVGQTTVTEGDSIRTGVTVIFPHAGNVFEERVPAAIHVGNGFGKLLGVTQVRELGELETPILLTSTLSVWRAADALVAWLLAQPGMEEVRSINPVVGETNDGYLNDIRKRPIRPEHVTRALERAASGAVEEGAVGAGTGTVAFGWKGGIGTSSRRLPAEQGGHTVGVLVQSNYGGDLTISGVHLGRHLGQQTSKLEAKGAEKLIAKLSGEMPAGNAGDGSIMIVVATDAPLSSRALERLASRAIIGLARTGSSMSNGSGDYVIAFSTAPECRRRRGESTYQVAELSNDTLSPLFQAVAEATEEAIYNSLFRATTTQGFRGTVEALPLKRTLELLKEARSTGKTSAPPSRKQ